ncbi:hypothetical protein TYRP_006338 [Tyrophagus putrescentiae]|nr:hypothetical protein TYRP_006338 [Tyrophagus putrescentiae]
MRPATKGPRSLMRTTTCFPPTVTLTCVPKGSVLWAAVSWWSGSKRSPLAVLWPAKPGPYQEHMPDSPANGGSGGG